MDKSVGIFAGKSLYLIVCKYINGSLALILITSSHQEFAYITKYVPEVEFKKKNQILLNPNLPKGLRELLEKKKIISKPKYIVECNYASYEQVDVDYYVLKNYDEKGTKLCFN